MTIIAAVSAWTAAYGPVMWGAIGIISALAISVIGLIISVGVNKLSESRYFESLASSPTNVNPLVDHFDHQRIKLSDLYGPKPIFHKKVFRDCEIIGPGALTVLSNCRMDGIGFSSCDLVIVKEGDMVYSAIGFIDSSFFNCEIFKATIFVPQRMAEEMIREFESRGGVPPKFIGSIDKPKEHGNEQGVNT